MLPPHLKGTERNSEKTSQQYPSKCSSQETLRLNLTPLSLVCPASVYQKMLMSIYSKHIQYLIMSPHPHCLPKTCRHHFSPTIWQVSDFSDSTLALMVYNNTKASSILLKHVRICHRSAQNAHDSHLTAEANNLHKDLCGPK